MRKNEGDGVRGRIRVALAAVALSTGAFACGALIGFEDLPGKTSPRDASADIAPDDVREASDTRGEPGTLDPSFGKGGISVLEWPNINSETSLMLDGEDILLFLMGNEPAHLAAVRCSKSGACDTAHAVTVFNGYISRVIPVRDPRGEGALIYGLENGSGDSPYQSTVHLVRLGRDGRVEELAKETLYAPTTQLEVAFAAGMHRSIGVDNSRPNDAGRMNLRAYLPDGGPDMQFGHGGRVSLATPAVYFQPGGVLLQSDGRVVLAGAPYVDELTTCLRFESDGGLETSFGPDGGVTLAVASPTIVPDGDGYLIGGMEVGPRAVLFRLTRDGRRDPSHWNDGMYRFDVSDDTNLPMTHLRSLAAMPGGTILAFGSMATETSNVVALARVSRGGLDPTFGKRGYVHIDEGEVTGQASMVVDADGYAVVAWRGADGSAKLARYRGE
ncbi:hypothetical protein LZC95_19135 [Pendulispora brunnea]|uniref:Delta-60 repeat protein n=1 Tax=Pendulispora brunnea TaxID=2905690 RepID=A0ABZ2KK51_9BACT